MSRYEGRFEQLGSGTWFHLRRFLIFFHLLLDESQLFLDSVDLVVQLLNNFGILLGGGMPRWRATRSIDFLAQLTGAVSAWTLFRKSGTSSAAGIRLFAFQALFACKLVGWGLLAEGVQILVELLLIVHPASVLLNVNLAALFRLMLLFGVIPAFVVAIEVDVVDWSI